MKTMPFDPSAFVWLIFTGIGPKTWSRKWSVVQKLGPEIDYGNQSKRFGLVTFSNLEAVKLALIN